MEILKSILQGITDNAPVTEVMRGLHWTVVVSRRCGLASTMILDTCDKEKESGDLTVRWRGQKDQQVLPLEQFVAEAQTKNSSRA